MMTTMAALMGTLPIAMGFGAGAESRRPLGLAVVGGLRLLADPDALRDAGLLPDARPREEETRAQGDRSAPGNRCASPRKSPLRPPPCASRPSKPRVGAAGRMTSASAPPSRKNGSGLRAGSGVPINVSGRSSSESCWHGTLLFTEASAKAWRSRRSSPATKPLPQEEIARRAPDGHAETAPASRGRAAVDSVGRCTQSLTVPELLAGPRAGPARVDSHQQIGRRERLLRQTGRDRSSSTARR